MRASLAYHEGRLQRMRQKKKNPTSSMQVYRLRESTPQDSPPAAGMRRASVMHPQGKPVGSQTGAPARIKSNSLFFEKTRRKRPVKVQSTIAIFAPRN